MIININYSFNNIKFYFILFFYKSICIIFSIINRSKYLLSVVKVNFVNFDL